MPGYFKIVLFYEMGKFPFNLISIHTPRTSMAADEPNKNQNLHSKVYENHSHWSKDIHISIRSCVSNLMLKDDKTRILGSLHPSWNCSFLPVRKAETLLCISEQTPMRIFSPVDRPLAYDSENYFFNQYLWVANLSFGNVFHFYIIPLEVHAGHPHTIKEQPPQAGINYTCTQHSPVFINATHSHYRRHLLIFLQLAAKGWGNTPNKGSWGNLGRQAKCFYLYLIKSSDTNILKTIS